MRHSHSQFRAEAAAAGFYVLMHRPASNYARFDQQQRPNNHGELCRIRREENGPKKKKTFHGWLPIWLIRNPLVSGMGAMIGCGLLTILELLGVIKAQPALTFTRFLTKQNKTE